MIELTPSEENYLKSIYHLGQQSDAWVSTNDLAKRINAKASSVTDMIKKLSDKSFIRYEKYKGFELTEEGKRAALITIRKHRLWETFLVEKLNFGWEEVHEIAEQLEHIQSPKLTEKLDEFLGFPEFDPHGDPIPDKEGKLPVLTKTVLLSELKPGQKAVVTGVFDSSSSFLKFLDKHKIELGKQIKIGEKFDFDHSTEIIIESHSLNLSKIAASKIIVQITP